MAKAPTKKRSGGRSPARKGSVELREAAPATGPDGLGSRVTGVYVAAVAFLTGASVMIVELAASRVLSPFFGNTLYTWTALIGVIMVALATGYYVGGRIADRAPRLPVLLHLVAGAAATVLAVPMLASSVTSGAAPEGQQPDLLWGPLWAALSLFALPGCLLGTVTPFAVKLLSLRSENERVGTSAGTVSGLSTVGSVLGTFGAGFVLIPSVSIRTIFIVVGATLAGVAALGYAGLLGGGRRSPKAAAALVVVAGLLGVGSWQSAEAMPDDVVFRQDTYYHRIQVLRHEGARGVIYELHLDNTSEGAQAEDSGDLVYAYTRYYKLERLFCPQMRRAAFLGGGAYAMPEALADDHEGLVVDVAEIDPVLEEVGRRYFRLDRYQGRVVPHVLDARAFLAGSRERYDLIFGDAYRGEQNVPSHMVTREFFELVRRRLGDDGVYMMNLIGGLQGDRSHFFRAAAVTIREVFPELYVFATAPAFPELAQNLILVAPRRARNLTEEGLLELAGEDRELRYMARTYMPEAAYDLRGGRVLTDDENPVEYIIAKQLDASRREQ